MMRKLIEGLGYSLVPSPGVEEVSLEYPPVLILGWRRLETLQQVIEATTTSSSAHIYISIDGPRPHFPSDLEEVTAVRRYIKSLEGSIKLTSRFQESNYGLRRSVLSAVSWFFANEKEGIVLEDDIVPSRSFFEFEAQMLERFRNELSVSSVAGTNHSEEIGDLGQLGYFSGHHHIWGYGTWADRWSLFEDFLRSSGDFEQFTREEDFIYPREAKFWRGRAEREFKGLDDNWDSSWNYFWKSRSSMCLIPPVTLVKNVGFGDPAASHSNRVPLLAGWAPSARTIRNPEFRPPPVLKPSLARDKYVLLTQWPYLPLVVRAGFAGLEILKRLLLGIKMTGLDSRSLSEPERQLTVIQHVIRFYLRKVGPWHQFLGRRGRSLVVGGSEEDVPKHD